MLGITALVAVGSLRDNLRGAIEEQTKGLLGADLVVTSRAAFTPEAEAFVAGLTPDRAREISFNPMLIVAGETGGTRLVQVRAVEDAQALASHAGSMQVAADSSAFLPIPSEAVSKAYPQHQQRYNSILRNSVEFRFLIYTDSSNLAKYLE